MIRWQHHLEQIRRALNDPTPVALEELLLPRDVTGALSRAMHPPPDVIPRTAAALVLFFPHEHTLWFPLTVRSGSLPLHRGEVSLPGGAQDAEDADLVITALREAEEEVGIQPDMVEVLGLLTSFYIPPSNFLLTPVVGFTAEPPVLMPNPHEVEAVFRVPLEQLLDPGTIVIEEWDFHGAKVHVPFFALEGYKVWGATAILLSELVVRLRRLEI